MATTEAHIKGNYPIPVYNYKVEIASPSSGSATVGFAEISGLQILYETITFKQSPGKDQKGPGPVVMFMPGQGTPSVITMKRGVIKNEQLRYFYDWFADVKANVVEKRDLQVYLLDESGEQIVGWKIINAFPTSIDAPTFSASSNEAAIESLVLTSDGVELMKL